MPTLREVAYSLYGAYRLARLDLKGLDYIDRSVGGAIRSFFAAAIVAPAYILLVLMRLGEGAGNVSFGGFLLVEGIAYVISWTAYALIMDDLTRILDRSSRYPAFLSVYNWSAVLQMLVYLPAVVLSESGIFVPAFGETIVFVATMIVLAYQWFVTRITLEVSGIIAAGLVILDLVLSVFISGAADGML
ncbi:MAG: hypothetical protein WCO00_04070 [Rhodospirillaceae bacterium]